MTKSSEILDDDAIAEIEARASTATEGPFDVLPVTTIDGDTAGFKWGRYLSDSRTADSFWDSELVPFEDAAFYAQARTNILALCNTVRVLRYQLDQVGKAFELEGALKLSEVGDLNALQVIKKMVSLQSQLEQVTKERDELKDNMARLGRARAREMESE